MKAADCHLLGNINAIYNFVAMVDGYHLQIQIRSKYVAGNVLSYISGNYETYSMSNQGASD
jgi:hypothetical protein